MKLDFLKAIASEIEIQYSGNAVPFSCYFQYLNNWFELKNANQTDAKTASILEEAKREKVFFRANTKKEIWMYFQDLDVIIRADFKKNIQAATVSGVRRQIEKSIRNATNAYKVTHHQLTQLLAKEAFKSEIEKIISSAREIAVSSPLEGQQQKTIAVLAFDIDKFKQVNDTYGHLYGDQVLKTFAFRLEEGVRNVNQQYGSKVQITLGHPSGEEFLALVVGTLSGIEIRDIADKFRQIIADKPLPNEDEWALLSKEPGLTNVVPPLLHERKITTSVGIAVYVGETVVSNFSAPSETLLLLDRADAALYRSKSGGRNRVTHFDEILQNCGRVLEFDTDTSVAAIDIGNKVGVTVGQEFRVFSAIFSGNTPFTVDDGRSKRTLGTYPRVEIGRLVVINSQNEMSFGQLIQKDDSITSPKNIHPGAILEAVPLGNISHLIERPGLLENPVGAPNVISGIELQARLDNIINLSKKPFVAVLKFQNEQAFVNKYGSASLNRALAKLYSGTVAIFSGTVSIGLIDRTSVCVVGVDSEFDDKESEIAEMLAERFTTDTELRPICGYFRPSSNLPIKNAIEFARYAASGNIDTEKNHINAFSVEIAETILSQHRSSRAFKAGIADYKRLKELGVTSASFENFAGLCYSGLQEYSDSRECYRNAMTAEPNNLTFIGNFGIMSDRLGEIDEGLKAFSSIKDVELPKLEKTPHGYIAYAVLLAKGQQSTYYSASRFKTVAEKAIKLKEAALWATDIELVKTKLSASTGNS